MLTESSFAHVKTDPLRKQTNTRQEITECLIVNSAISDSGSHCHLLHCGLARKLRLPVQKVHLEVLNLVESLVSLATFRVNNYSISKLAALIKKRN